ncbi:phosphatidylinositol alpha-1,6-mannosyltransferase [Luteibacter sp. W1I16]|uniref:glycosyltransferase family 4 protein n=1 Tax=Luteibacter sp. W1I16 TaxID=3373922 RepID=UPI003D261715
MRHVLLITRNLPPLRGGMERLNLQLARELNQGGSLDVVGPEGCRGELPDGVTAIECRLKPLPIFLFSALFGAMRAVLRRRPSFVMAGSGLCAPFAWIAARLSGARAAVYLHGLDIVVDSAVYRNLWLPFIRHCDVCVVNSKNTAELAVAAGISSERIRIVHPGVDLPQEFPHGSTIDSFRRDKGWGGRRVLLSVGRLTERKGLVEFIEYVLPLIVERYPDILLAVVGNDAPDALRRVARSVRTSVEVAVSALGLERHVVMHGELNDEDLKRAYAAADVAIFPVRDIPGDVEGFGMVAIEAAAHGLPTVAFAVGGVPDAVSNGISGFLVKPGDYPGFVDAIGRVLDAASGEFKSGSREFAKGFAWASFGEKIRPLTEAKHGT